MGRMGEARTKQKWDSGQPKVQTELEITIRQGRRLNKQLANFTQTLAYVLNTKRL